MVAGKGIYNRFFQPILALKILTDTGLRIRDQSSKHILVSYLPIETHLVFVQNFPHLLEFWTKLCQPN